MNGRNGSPHLNRYRSTWFHPCGLSVVVHSVEKCFYRGESLKIKFYCNRRVCHSLKSTEDPEAGELERSVLQRLLEAHQYHVRHDPR